ncbi:hypothetical protein [Lederbergia lenta]|uniref:hypothetical protein n=1 Tax=Lederbergia lenta TaxID=1467 RepID=UPI00203E1300|nr:hypothetical protein [Lederbergia lenta]MCM3111697.1 hypothetical protein [Lederbergia lenta]
MINLEEELLKIGKRLGERGIQISEIGEIIELHLKISDNNKLNYNKLVEHLEVALSVDPSPMLHYLAQGNLEISSKTEFIKQLDAIKFRYNIFIKDAIQAMNNPFLLTYAQTNVEPGNSLHKITLKRTDGRSLDAMFTPASLLPIMSLLTNSTTHAIQEGVYHLNEDMIKAYVNETNQLSTLLLDLISNKEKFEA